MRHGRYLLLALTLAAAAPTPAAPEHGTTFKNWTVGCEEIEGREERQCYIFQNIALKESGKRLLHVAVGYMAATGDSAAILTLPLGIFLPPGVALVVDEGEPIRVPVQHCTDIGCRGVVPLTAELTAQMKKGREARVIFKDGTRREIAVPVSLLGFTAGFNTLEK